MSQRGLRGISMYMNFLFIGVEPSFMAYFFTKEMVFTSSLDSCRTIAEAEIKLESAIYDAYFVDDVLAPQDELLEFLKKIRGSSPNGVLVVISAEEKAFPEGLVNAVLSKPLAPQEVDQLFRGSLSACDRETKQFDLKGPASEFPVVFIIDPDRTFLDLVHKVKEKFPFDVKSATDPKEAIAFLRVKGFHPRALVAAESFPGSAITGFDIIDEKRKDEKNIFISAIILSQCNEKGNIQSRVLAMEKHIDYVFHKPIYAYTFLQSIKEALEVQFRLNYKVLILDDDEDFCGFAMDILKDAGIEVSAIHRAEDLFRTLDEKKPQLLLLDLKLPAYDGMHLLRTLRQDVTYSNLKVVIITGADESSTKLSAYSAKADEIIYKPIDPILFQKRILNFAEMQTYIAQNETGMGSLKELITKIHLCLDSEVENQAILAIFEINQLDQWIKSHGTSSGSELLVSIGNELLLEMDEGVESFNYDLSRYALIFEKNTLAQVGAKMQILLSHLSEREILSDIGFNCSVLEISKKYGNAEQNWQEAERRLLEAREKDTAPIKMKVESIDESTSNKKEIVLIDEDQQLNKILKRNFESYGINVTTFTDGKTALANLLNRKDRELPALIILERKLEAMDGLDVIIKLKEHFKHSIPFFALTFFGADKDVMKGVKEGAIEYMTKPFNTSILMEKALKTIEKRT